jgi:hypothetical protein
MRNRVDAALLDYLVCPPSGFRFGESARSSRPANKNAAADWLILSRNILAISQMPNVAFLTTVPL